MSEFDAFDYSIVRLKRGTVTAEFSSVDEGMGLAIWTESIPKANALMLIDEQLRDLKAVLAVLLSEIERAS